MQIITLLFTFTVQMYIYPSVIIGMRIVKVQVNGSFPKRGRGAANKQKPIELCVCFRLVGWLLGWGFLFGFSSGEVRGIEGELHNSFCGFFLGGQVEGWW